MHYNFERPIETEHDDRLLRKGLVAQLLNALIDAPVNRHLVEMIHEIEQRKRAITPANLAELA